MRFYSSILTRAHRVFVTRNFNMVTFSLQLLLLDQGVCDKVNFRAGIKWDPRRVEQSGFILDKKKSDRSIWLTRKTRHCLCWVARLLACLFYIYVCALLCFAPAMYRRMVWPPTSFTAVFGRTVISNLTI